MNTLFGYDSVSDSIYFSPQFIRLCLMLIFFISPSWAQFTPVDLNNWRQEGLLSNGNWTISAEGTSVLQSINGAPTFFVSPDTIFNTVVRGKFRVETSRDDDFIGFVFGYQRPRGEEEYYDFLLFDWKQVTQTWSSWTGYEGFTLSRLDGIITGNLASGNVPYWGHADTNMTVLDTRYADTLGWADNTEYLFELSYRADRIVIKIDSVTIFDINGTFQPGRFGFYNYSQPNVRYQEFILNQYPVAVNDTVATSYQTATVIPILANDYDPDGDYIHLVSISWPQNGTIEINPDSTSITYTPDTLFAGNDTLVYSIKDSSEFVDSAYVFITVDEPQSIFGQSAGKPNRFALHPNYPNPFNPTTVISYQLSAVSQVELSIYNLLGQKVATLVNSRKAAGEHQVKWDASGYAGGVYYYRLNTDAGFVITRKLVLLK